MLARPRLALAHVRSPLGFHPRIVQRPELLEAAEWVVYPITDMTAIKLGKSRWLPHAQRVHELATGNPRQMVVLAWTTHLTERQAHRRLAQWRLRGEWFTICESVLMTIREVHRRGCLTCSYSQGSGRC
jgi:hypothetical protein